VKNEPATSSSKAIGTLSKNSAYAILLVLSIIWGLAFVAIRVADFELAPINLTLLRWFIASAGFLALSPLALRGKPRLQRQDLPRLLVISFANVAAYHLSLNYGETSVSSGLAGLLVSLGPVFIAILSAYTLKEKVGRGVVLALMFAVAGALILSINDLNAGSVLGPIEVVITALSYAIFTVLAKPLVGKYGPLPIATWAGLIGTAMILPLLSTGFFVQIGSLSLMGWFSVGYLAILSTVFGYFMFYTLVSRGSVSRLSIQLYLIPIVSVIGGALLLNETVTIFTIMGGAMMLTAIAIATRRKSR
jgi:drug/metabolite transporter (DMT)-like permease